MRRLQHLAHPVRGALDWLYPPTCVLCGGPGGDGMDLCAGCRADLPRITPCCQRCAMPLAHGQREGVLCGACQRRPPPFAHCQAAFRYQDPIPELIAGLKFRHRLNLGRLLGTLLADHLSRQAGPLPDAIVPVPLHPRRLRERGFNQSLEIARVVGRTLALPIDRHCCARLLPTTPQARLERQARLRNLRGAFRATPGLDGLHLALLDDVVTTGTTVGELTRVLQRAGAARVDVWAVARTA